MIENPKVNDNVITLLGRKPLVEIVCNRLKAWIALKNLLRVFFPSFNTSDLGSKHGKEVANITIPSAQFQNSFAFKKFMSVMIENGLNTLCSPVLVHTLELGVVFPKPFVNLVTKVSFYPKCHWSSIFQRRSNSRKL
jgi:hypothetical protein